MTLIEFLKGIADAIRSKDETTASIPASDMAARIKAIETGVDTTDATATAADIASGKTAYVNDQKITGNVDTIEAGASMTYGCDQYQSGADAVAYAGKLALIANFAKSWLFRAGSKFAVTVDLASLGTASAADVMEGKTFTSAAGLQCVGTAAAFLGQGRTQAKTVSPSRSKQVVAPDSGYDFLTTVTVEAIPDNLADVSGVTAQPADVKAGVAYVDADGVTRQGTATEREAPIITLTPDRTAYDIQPGFYEDAGLVQIDLEEVTVTPTTAAQTVKPSSGRVLSKVIVEAADPGIDTSDANAPAEGIREGYTAYVDGVKVWGTMPNHMPESYKLAGVADRYDILRGFHTGYGSVSLSDVDQARLIPENIAEGITILGVEGAHKGGNTECAMKITSGAYLFWNGARFDQFEEIMKHIEALDSLEMMFYKCEALEEFSFDGIDTSAATTAKNCFQSCTSLKKIDFSAADFSSITTTFYLMRYCSALEEVVGLSLPAATGTATTWTPAGTETSPYPLRRFTFRTDLDAPSVQMPIKISYCSMEREATLEMFNTLPDLAVLALASPPAITLTGNPCATGVLADGTACEILTADDQAIATAKGWTIVL